LLKNKKELQKKLLKENKTELQEELKD